MSEAIVFAATCPRCKREQLQTGYTLGDLNRLIDGGHPIETYCEFCDEFWAVSPGERTAIASELNGGRTNASSPREKGERPS